MPSRSAPGPFVQTEVRVFGKLRTLDVCMCARCSADREALPRDRQRLREASHAIRDTKRRLRQHARQSRVMAPARGTRRWYRAAPLEQILAESRKHDPPCVVCGKAPGHERCGVADGSPEGRAAHGRRVRAGKALAARARARTAAVPAVVSA